ncbi:MAG: TVP38/TMEM64 family protein, partial [bacterium]
MSRETREEDDPGDRGDPGEEEEVLFAKPKSASPLWRPALLIVALVVLFVAARAFDLGQRVGELRAWIDSLGPWGPLAFIGLYVLATIAMIPGSGPTVLAGGLFGSIWGTVYVSLASTTGAAA